MSGFAYADVPHDVRESLSAAHRNAWQALAGPGSWWTGAERLAIAEVARSAYAARNEPPWLRGEVSETDGVLSPRAVEVARRVAAEAHRLERDWCETAVADLGDAAYVELVSVVVCVVAIDAFADALGATREPLPNPQPGEPDRARPDSVGDGGAWVPMTVPWSGPNVARALSLSPGGQAMFFGLVAAMYAFHDFTELVWDRPLSRPQVEVVAARVSAVNECFY